jgi:hypothetical protein
LSAPEVRNILAHRGIEMRTEAVRTSMSRLVEKDKKLTRLGDGPLRRSQGDASDRNGADPSLFTGDQRHSQAPRRVSES